MERIDDSGGGVGASFFVWLAASIYILTTYTGSRESSWKKIMCNHQVSDTLGFGCVTWRNGFMAYMVNFIWVISTT